MWKKVKQLKCFGLGYFDKDKMLLQTLENKNDKNYILSYLDIETLDKDKLSNVIISVDDYIDMTANYSFIRRKKDNTTSFYDKNWREILKLNNTKIYTIKEEENSIWGSIDKGCLEIRKDTLEYYNYSKPKTNLSFPLIYKDIMIYSSFSEEIEAYRFNKGEIEFLWNIDIGSLTMYENPFENNKLTIGDINSICKYKDSIIVLGEYDLIRIDIRTGNILYHKKRDFYLSDIVIVGDIVYGVCSNRLCEFDVKTGEILRITTTDKTLVVNGEEYTYTTTAPIYYFNGYIVYRITLFSCAVTGMIGIWDVNNRKHVFTDFLGAGVPSYYYYSKDTLFIADTTNKVHIYKNV